MIQSHAQILTVEFDRMDFQWPLHRYTKTVCAMVPSSILGKGQMGVRPPEGAKPHAKSAPP